MRSQKTLVSQKSRNLKHGATGKLGEDNSSNIKVCVRVRPFASREAGEELVIDMPATNTVVLSGGDEQEPKIFGVDRAYWSHSPAANFADQNTLMSELGVQMLENAQNGFNNCLFAYGQTGSGKTHSVIGQEDPPENQGLLPRIIDKLFEDIAIGEADGVTCVCKVSYLEIYNEHIHDLLVPVQQRQQDLDVHHNPQYGVYVKGLTEENVSDQHAVKKLMQFGIKSRSIAATSMNAGSSRSHCIFTFSLEQTRITNGGKSCRTSRVNLVDLAGSERQSKAQTTGERLKEGAAINQSLSALSQVIHTLAEGRGDHVPFRNSKLTHLLQDSLSGNSKTVMIAALSPALSNYEETLGTLRFAQTCKNVVTHATVNEESSEAVVHTLKAEIERLQAEMATGGFSAEAEQKLKESEEFRAKLEEDMNKTLEHSRKMEESRSKALEDMGLSFDEIASQFGVAANTPKLVNISEDPSLSGSLLYLLEEGKDILVGENSNNMMCLTGVGMTEYMCKIRNDDGKVTLWLLGPGGQEITDSHSKSAPKAARVLVNGRTPESPKELRHMDRLILGYAFSFRLTHPEQAEAAQGASDGDDMDLAAVLQEVFSDEAPEIQECKAVMDALQDRLGLVEATNFLNLFKESFPLIQEANQMNNVMRPDDQLRFQMEVCSDIMTFTTDEPELIVRLYQRHDDGQEYAVDVFELHQFDERLQVLRDTYQSRSRQGGGRGSLTISQDEYDDPWVTYTSADVRSKLEPYLKEIDKLKSDIAYKDQLNKEAGSPWEMQMEIQRLKQKLARSEAQNRHYATALRGLGVPTPEYGEDAVFDPRAVVVDRPRLEMSPDSLKPPSASVILNCFDRGRGRSPKRKGRACPWVPAA